MIFYCIWMNSCVVEDTAKSFTHVKHYKLALTGEYIFEKDSFSISEFITDWTGLPKTTLFTIRYQVAMLYIWIHQIQNPHATVIAVFKQNVLIVQDFPIIGQLQLRAKASRDLNHVCLHNQQRNMLVHSQVTDESFSSLEMVLSILFHAYSYMFWWVDCCATPWSWWFDVSSCKILVLKKLWKRLYIVQLR